MKSQSPPIITRETAVKAMHNRIGPFFFDVPDFDDCGGRTMRRVEVPKQAVKQILEAADAQIEALQKRVAELEAELREVG